ncbi:MAG: ATP-binding protein [Armatimonadetes bacterium]|nr:ATP-binding protein [Armatimonadota bacterium]
MITRLAAWGYKCLADVDVRVGPFNILVGPNATGKSTFLDVLGLLSDALQRNGDIDAAIRSRARTVRELVWQQSQDWFDLAVEARLPDHLRKAWSGQSAWESVAYRVRMGIGADGATQVKEERAFGAPTRTMNGVQLIDQQPLFDLSQQRDPIMEGLPPEGSHQLLRRLGTGASQFQATGGGKGKWPYKPNATHLALASTPEDPDKFAVLLWLRDLLRDRVRFLHLNSTEMRKPCRPDAPRELQADGGNLPIVAARLRDTAPDRFRWWQDHVAGVLGGLKELRVEEQAHDRHLYLSAVYEGGPPVPSWLLSDGTLRFLAMTLIAYLRDTDTIYIIEEPENGIHPRALEAVMDSLSSVYEGQVFAATHSPLVVGLSKPEHLLCFDRNPDGSTAVIPGNEHPALRDWNRSVSLADLYAAGVLG